jgi:CubicO group peptidase (beta-lactamase class C family)
VKAHARWQGGKLPASNSPSQFPFLSDTSEDKKLSMRAQRIFNNNEGMNAFMIIEDGKIIYEGYKKNITKNSPLLSASMAKSLTAMILGGVICSNSNIKIHAPMGKHSTRLQCTMFSSVTIFNALRVSSGNIEPLNAGQNVPRMFGCLSKKNNLLVSDIFYPKYAKQELPQGTAFRHVNSDTLAISEMIANITKSKNMLYAFNEHIWSKIQPENHGTWLTDKLDNLLSFGGFIASLRDWARLSVWT